VSFAAGALGSFGFDVLVGEGDGVGDALDADSEDVGPDPDAGSSESSEHPPAEAASSRTAVAVAQRRRRRVAMGGTLRQEVTRPADWATMGTDTTPAGGVDTRWLATPEVDEQRLSRASSP
jgi:hypothetical protein